LKYKIFVRGNTSIYQMVYWRIWLHNYYLEVLW